MSVDLPIRLLNHPTPVCRRDGHMRPGGGRRYVKGSYSRSLTVRNLQLSLFGLPFSLAYALAKDGHGGGGGSLMRGFDALAWSVVALQVPPGTLC